MEEIALLICTSASAESPPRFVPCTLLDVNANRLNKHHSGERVSDYDAAGPRMLQFFGHLLQGPAKSYILSRVGEMHHGRQQVEEHACLCRAEGVMRFNQQALPSSSVGCDRSALHRLNAGVRGNGTVLSSGKSKELSARQ